MNDTEMLDWLAEHWEFISEEFAPGYTFGNDKESNHRALRAAIQRARLKELHNEAER